MARVFFRDLLGDGFAEWKRERVGNGDGDIRSFAGRERDDFLLLGVPQRGYCRQALIAFIKCLRREEVPANEGARKGIIESDYLIKRGYFARVRDK